MAPWRKKCKKTVKMWWPHYFGQGTMRLMMFMGFCILIVVCTGMQCIKPGNLWGYFEVNEIWNQFWAIQIAQFMFIFLEKCKKKMNVWLKGTLGLFTSESKFSVRYNIDCSSTTNSIGAMNFNICTLSKLYYYITELGSFSLCATKY